MLRRSVYLAPPHCLLTTSATRLRASRWILEGCDLRVFISGAHSGPNPSPGLGTARSLRSAYPDLNMVAVDYSRRSSGLHADVFDDIWVQRSWTEIHLELYGQQVREALGSDGIWLSGLDLEVIWLSQNAPGDRRIPVPPGSALRATRKPGIQAHKDLSLRVPPFMETVEPDWSLHAFCRRHGWQVWLKGPYYEARRIASWIDFETARAELAETWGTEELFLQPHVAGYEESISFCALDGKLLDAVYMAKRDVTNEGKTWAGKISEVPDDIYSALRKTVLDLGWSGGAEIECVRDRSGKLWVIDWNPRFPAWIYGATLAGHNLPAQLVSAVSGMEPAQRAPESNEFTRVVVEIPTNKRLPLMTLEESTANSFGWFSKHPSGMPQLAKRLRSQEQPRPVKVTEAGAGDLEAELRDASATVAATPQRVLLKKRARMLFEQAAEAARCASKGGVTFHLAYSIKTDPSPDLLMLALEAGMLAEAISLPEMRMARRIGFELAEVVFNGPAKTWTTGAVAPQDLKIAFCDSLEELELLEQTFGWPQTVGIRLRPPSVISRFGIRLDEPDYYRKLVDALQRVPPDRTLGIHFHIASSAIGTDNWWSLLDSMLTWAKQIERHSGRQVSCIDLGGGWFPDDWSEMFLPHLPKITASASRSLPGLRDIILEPGKALSQSSSALITRVLEVRALQDESKEIVVDAAVSDLPQMRIYPHRIFARNDAGNWRALGRGEDRILGRICMEHDIVAHAVSLPVDVTAGDILIVGDAGAYDRSMAYDFGRGE